MSKLFKVSAIALLVISCHGTGYCISDKPVVRIERYRGREANRPVWLRDLPRNENVIWENGFLENLSFGEIDSLQNATVSREGHHFSVPGDGWANSKDRYVVDIKFNKDGTPSLAKLNVEVKCDCPFFIYNGPEHNAKSNGYLYGSPRGTATPPNVRDPSRQYYICKHIAAIFNLISNRFKIPSNYFKV